MNIEELLQTPYYIIDILPKQVPAEGAGRYFAVEKYYLEESRLSEIKQKHINVILKLNCYRDMEIDGEVNPEPDKIAEEMKTRYLNILTDNAMIISEPDDTHMTIFNPDEELLELVRTIVEREGLYIWQP